MFIIFVSPLLFYDECNLIYFTMKLFIFVALYTSFSINENILL